MASANFGNANAGFQAVTINGPVHTSFHVASEPRDAPPQPSIVIPFARDSDYVERGTLLDTLRKECALPNSRRAIVGLGGVGKSQLAIEHAYRTREQSPETWVLWAHGSNAARLEQSFRDIADRVKIVGRQDPQADIFKLVHDWLCDVKARWLLVLDNVDDARFLVETRGVSSNKIARPLCDYLPHCEWGSILVTSRSIEAALNLVEQRDIIALDPMSEVQSLALLEKKLGAHADSNAIVELVATLENMPLAIVQAAAFISQRLPRYSVSKYLDDFRKSERKKTSLLHSSGGQLRRDREAKNSVITTWQISFEYIQQMRSSAADLLSLMSFFDRQGIPADMLRTRVSKQEDGAGQGNIDEENDELLSGFMGGHSEDADSESSNDDDAEDEAFQEDIIMLTNFRFISVNADGTSIDMHALVQLSMRAWLAANGRLERWRGQFVSMLCAVFPTGEYENWATCQALFAHAKAAVAHKPEAVSLLLQWATLLHRAAWYSWKKGNAHDTEILAVKAKEAREQVLGQEHANTISSMIMVAHALSLGGRFNNAEKTDIELLQICKKELGITHPLTLVCMANLAITYNDQGRWDEAEILNLWGVKLRKATLGADHLFTMTSIQSLASTYIGQKRWCEAYELSMQVLEMRKVKLGSDHPSTLTCMHNLAFAYSNQDRWNEAEQLGLQVVEMRKAKLGADHPGTLTSMHNLAFTYSNQDKWDEAEKLGIEVVEKRTVKLGVEHIDTLMSMHNLASTYNNQERWSKAEKLGVQVVDVRKAKLGVDHLDTLASMHNLAFTYSNQNRWREAEKLGVEVVMRKVKLGVDDLDVLGSMINLARTYWKLEQWDRVEKVTSRILQIRKVKLGAKHRETLKGMHSLAQTWKRLGRGADAIELLRECTTLRKQTLEADHPDLLCSLSVLERWESEDIIVV